MSYSRRARIDDKMSREEQEDLALHNANKGMSLNSIAELLDLTVYMVEKYIQGQKRERLNLLIKSNILMTIRKRLDLIFWLYDFTLVGCLPARVSYSLFYKHKKRVTQREKITKNVFFLP